MTAARVRVGDVLRLERFPIVPDPSVEYVAIGVRSFGKGIFHYEPTVGSSLGSLRFYEIKPGCLVVSNIKGWEGAVATATASELGCIASNRFLTYVPIDGRIDISWARWYFLSEGGIERLQRASPGSADRNRTLAIERFENLVIPIPPIEAQLRVAQRLGSLSAIATSVLDDLDGTPAETFTAALPGIYDLIVSSGPTILSRLANLVDFVSDTIHLGDDPGEASEFVGLQHVDGDTGICLGSDPIDELKGRKFRFRPGDVVYGYLRPYLNKVWLADRDGLCSVDQYVLRPKPDVNGELLAFSLRGRAVLDRSIELTHNLQLPRLRSGLLADTPILLPDVERAAPSLKRLNEARSAAIELRSKRGRQRSVAASIVPAALREAFGAF